MNKDERRRWAYDQMVKDSVNTAHKMGNSGKITMRQIEEHCQKVAEKATKEMDNPNIKRKSPIIVNTEG